MLNAWRKLTKKQDERHVFPTGVAPIDQQMQKKYAKGVQYNMKIIIKGDRNTGKTTLLHRLTGGKFKEAYIPTHEIQVANVNWNYRGAADVVKVEVWDIVDKSQKKRTASDSLKLTNEEVQETPTESFSLDAELINVYKGTHGVILTMDITKAWKMELHKTLASKLRTWQYVQRELDIIPSSIPVLVLANFRDMGDHRVVQADEIIAHVEHLDRPTGSAEVYFSESSMSDGFGLKLIYKFLNMPFLLLQRETLMRQLEVNTLEIEEMREELSIDATSEEQNYGLFKDMVAESLNPQTKKDSNPTTPVEERKNESMIGSSVSSDSPIISPTSPVTNEVAEPEPERQQEPIVTPVQTTPTQPEAQQKPVQTTSRFQAYKAKLFGGSSAESNQKKEPEVLQPTDDADVVPIDDFNPGQLDDAFLSNASTQKNTNKQVNQKVNDSDSDEDNGNPLVAGYEDFDDSDNESIEPPNVTGNAGNNDDESDDDFDDLSDDERKEIETNDNPIIEQIKSSKKNKTTDLDIDSVVVSTHTLDINDTNEYNNLDDNVAIIEANENAPTITTDIQTDIQQLDTPNTKESIQNTHNETNTCTELDNTLNNTPNNTLSDVQPKNNDQNDSEESEEDDDRDGNVYVISGHVDVDNDWLNNNSDSENENENEADGDDNEDNVGGDENKSFENKLENIETDKNDVQAESSINDSSLNFNVDDLEMFMSDQMSKATVEPTVISTEEDVPKPKKKKKKKTVTDEEKGTSQDVDVKNQVEQVTTTTTTTGEKKKKKKKITKDTQATTDTTTTPSTTPKTKKSKTKNTEGVSSSNETLKTKKKTADGTATTTTKKKKKKTSTTHKQNDDTPMKSDYDAFFDS